MNNPKPRQITIQPIISYPREAEVGKTYLMTVDVNTVLEEGEWYYAEEEYDLYCILDTEPLFTQEPVGKPTIILNRFGGSYGPATFLLTADREEQTGAIRINLLLNGLIVQIVHLDNIRLVREPQRKGKLVSRPETGSSPPNTALPSLESRNPAPLKIPSVHDIRRPYDRNLYVQRDGELVDVQAWRQSKKRVLTIFSPPAQGKSWFFARFYELIRHEENQPAFFINLSDFLKPGALDARDVDDARLSQWVHEFRAILCTKYNDLPQIEITAEISMNIDFLAGYINNLSKPDQFIYLFVDGSDETSHSAFRLIEHMLFEPIMRHSNWRLVITQRNAQKIHSPMLRRTEHRVILPLLTDGSSTDISRQGIAQLQKLLFASINPRPLLEEIITTLPGYLWTHPGLNFFLFLDVMQNYHEQGRVYLKRHLLKRGIASLAFLDGSKLPQITNLLRAISKLHDDWQIEELASDLGISLTDAWQTVSMLRDYFLITSIDNRFRITDGVREFVRAAIAIELIQKPQDLHVLLSQDFSISEFEMICSDLNIDVQTLPIDKNNRVDKLIETAEHHKRLDKLLKWLMKNRPEENFYSYLYLLIHDTFNTIVDFKTLCSILDIDYQESLVQGLGYKFASQRAEVIKNQSWEIYRLATQNNQRGELLWAMKQKNPSLDLTVFEEMTPLIPPNKQKYGKIAIQGVFTSPDFPAIIIGGPPHSGKSTFVYSLTKVLRQKLVPHYVLRASPDGEGYWSNETDQALVRKLRNKGSFTPAFIEHTSKNIQNRHLPLLVDVDGLPTTDQQEMFSACTHAILLIAGNDEAAYIRNLATWRRIMVELGVEIIAELRSVLPGKDSLTATSPIIQGTIANLERGKPADGSIVEACIEKVSNLFAYDEASLNEWNLAQAPIELTLDIPKLAQTLGAEDGHWQPAQLPKLVDYLPAKKPLALYGRSPNWINAALAMLAYPAPLWLFDVRLGWIQPPVLSKKTFPVQLGWETVVLEYETYWLLTMKTNGQYLDFDMPEAIPLPTIKPGKGLVLSGKIPHWLLTAVVRQLAPAHPWTAVFQPQLNGAVVVYSEDISMPIGQVTPLL